MTVDARIKAALEPFGDPVENVVYQSTEKQYYTFNYSTLGADYGDDAPGHERYLIQVHYFAPLNVNITQRVKETKRALAAAGFTYPETVNATDEDGRHIVFECETAGAAEEVE